MANINGNEIYFGIIGKIGDEAASGVPTHAMLQTDSVFSGAIVVSTEPVEDNAEQG